jgi:hypothetical protein
MRIALRTRVRAGLLETTHDYSPGGGDAALPVVWQL